MISAKAMLESDADKISRYKTKRSGIGSTVKPQYHWSIGFRTSENTKK
jgi:hypothetical protein